MTCHIVVEGPTIARLMHWLLQQEISQYGERVHIKEKANRSSAEDYAKSVMLVRGEPAAIIVNVSVTDPWSQMERKSFLEYYFKQAAPSYLYKILYVAPSLEVILFHDEPLLQDVFGRPLTAVERARAEYDPRRVLTELAAETQLDLDEVWRRITAHSPDVVRTVPPIPELLDFIHRSLSGVPASASA